MEVRYKSDVNHNYMIIKREKNVKQNHEKMMIRNNIEGLLKMNLHYIDETAWYYYEIQSRQSLSRLFEGRTMSFDELYNFLYGMVKVFKELEAYLLPSDGILIDPDLIYVDIDSCSPEFAFYPSSKEENVREDFIRLSEFLAEHIDRDDKRSTELAYDYYMSVSDGIFSPEGILKTKPVSVKKEEEQEYKEETPEFDYWETEEDMSQLDYFLKDEEEKKKDSGSLKIAVMSMGLIIAAVALYLIFVLNPEMFPFFKLNETEYIFSGCVIALLFGAALTALIFIYNRHRVKKGLDEEEEKKKKLEIREDDPLIEKELREYNEKIDPGEVADDRTTLLSIKGYASKAVLSGREYGRELYFAIDRDPFILGKKKDKADGFVDDPAVSRLHASVSEKNGRFFLSDLNSTNGTFLNGRKLEPNETVGLEDGDTVSIAGTCMRFRVS